jgi:hypothetical protein
MLARSESEVDRIELIFDVCLLAIESACFSMITKLSELGF